MKKWLGWILAALLCLNMCPAASAQGVGIYGVGDLAPDFTLTTNDGEEVSLSGLLTQYDAVVLNFWFAACGPCQREFPYLQEAYDRYADDVYLLCITPADSNETIRQFKEYFGLHLNMASDLKRVVEGCYVTEGYPTTVVIDRFGMICWKECGTMPDTGKFERLFEGFVGDDYTESKVGYVIPDEAAPAMYVPEALNAALREGTGLTWAESMGSTEWAWVAAGDGESICASNAGHHETAAVARATVEAAAGDALAMDVRPACELGFDRLEVYLDGARQMVITGIQDDWTTRAVAIGETGGHELELRYVKDWIGSDGEDNVYVKDIRVLSGEPAAAALAKNPVYPAARSEGMELVPQGENIRKIVFLKDGVPCGENLPPCYLVGDEQPVVKLLAGADFEPADYCAITSNDWDEYSLLAIETDEEGWVFRLKPMREIRSAEGEYGYIDVVAVSEKVPNAQTAAMVLLTEGEMLDVFMRTYVMDEPHRPEAYSWRYADAHEVGTEPDEAEYVIAFVDPDGKPVPGVMANVCDEDTCMPQMADEEGRVVFTAKAYPYEVHVLRAPEGYAFDANQGYALPAEGGTLEIVLQKH